MSATENTFPKPELETLLAQLCDGRLEPVGQQRLEEILISSPTARSYYHAYIDLHLELADRSERELAIGLDTADPARTSVLRFPVRSSVLAALVATLAIATLFLFRNNDRANPPRAESASANPVAMVTNSVNADWVGTKATPEVGDYFTAGSVHRLASGNIALRYLNGAEITLRGPVDFEIRGEMELYVSHGSVAADIPKSAHGFTILTPNAAFVDLGTKFSLNVTDEENSASDLFVREGLVYANLLGDNGTTVSGLPARAGGSIRVDSGGFSPGTADPAIFLEPLPREETHLRISESYRQAVRSAGPLGYWTFEGLLGNQAANEMGPNFAGRLSGEVNAEIAGGNTSLHFKNSRDPANFHVPEAFNNLNDGKGYSIELWFNADSRKYASLATLHSPRTPDQIAADHFGEEVPYLSQLEVLGENARAAGLICEDFSFRQVHRAPAGSTAGTNAITSITYQAHRWYHLVAVVTPADVVLYVDGEEVRRVPHSGKTDHSPFLLSAGRLRPVGYTGTYRQFHGRIDELALYDRPLSGAEIREHYDIVRAGLLKKN